MVLDPPAFCALITTDCVPEVVVDPEITPELELIVIPEGNEPL